MLKILEAFTDVRESKGTQMVFRSVLYYWLELFGYFFRKKKNARIYLLKLILFVQKTADFEEF